MDRKKHVSIFLFCVFILFSCAARENTFVFPVPDKNLFENDIYVNIGNITESRDMEGRPYLPGWLSAFLGGGIEEAEKIEAYTDRYLFVANNHGTNFASLSRWANYFSAERDFPLLAAARIEKRMNASNTMYPDEEYGIFYETFVKNAYSGEYPGVKKEDTCWIKTRASGGGQESAALQEVFDFYILISIDKAEMQELVFDLFSRALASSAPAGAQAAAINRLRQTFFEVF
jgi:hypothetical protein